MLLALVIAIAAAVVLVVQLIRIRRRFDSATASLERERAELQSKYEAAESQRATFVDIINSLGEGLLAIDRERRVVLANRRFTDLLRAEDAAGKPLHEVVRIASVFDAFDAALDGSESTERFSTRVGVVERRIELRAFPVPSDDIAAVALFIDVTLLERLEQIRRDFIADFSHEARTPLTAMRSAVDSFELGAEHMTAEEDQQLRRIMSRQLRRLERLVDDLSELSRIESGDLPLERGQIDLRAMISELAEDFADRASEKDLQFAIRGESVRVVADSMRIQQAFSNLIDNAIKYGGTQSTIDIDIHASNDRAVVRITDHGEGVAPEEKERIFRRFYRVDKSRSQDIAGTGLGLAITKHLVLLHRGTIDVESEPGKGATFVVSLPKR
jgi:two-component system phosphate regulon sensor histidine kinase PhoR